MPSDMRETATLLAERATGGRAVAAEPLVGGYANDMVRVDLDDGGRVVVRLHRRRPQVAAIEAAVLARAVGLVPAPRVLLDDARGEVAGRPALVMSWVDGVPAAQVLAGAPERTALGIGRLLGRTLAALGGMRFASPGFFGGPDLDPAGLGGGLDEQVQSALDDVAEGAGARLLDARLFSEWASLCLDTVPADGVGEDDAALVHADFNPKNVLLRPDGNGWAVAAVVDWEFAFAGSPLFDLGNLLRFAGDQPAGYTAAVASGFAAGGGALPEGWRRTAAVLDALSLCEFLAAGPSSAYFDATVRLMRDAVARGDLVGDEG